MQMKPRTRVPVEEALTAESGGAPTVAQSLLALIEGEQQHRSELRLTTRLAGYRVEGAKAAYCARMGTTRL